MTIFKIPLSFVGAANFKFISVGLYQTPICAKVSEKCQIRSNPSPGPQPPTTISRTMMMVKKLWGGDGETNTRCVLALHYCRLTKKFTHHECCWVTRFLIKGSTIRGLWGWGISGGAEGYYYFKQLPLTTHNSCYMYPIHNNHNQNIVHYLLVNNKIGNRK